MSKKSIPHKLNLAQVPTPIQHSLYLSRLASKFGAIQISVKRDDFTHGPAAGNKIRKLEYLLGDALHQKRKVIFTCGGIQSNHARATAVLCRELGLECVLFLQGDSPAQSQVLEANLLLDHLCGAKIHYISKEEYENIERVFSAAAQFYRKRDGVEPYFIPEGGSCVLGSMGYVSALQEIMQQAGEKKFTSIVLTTGSGGTHAGLLMGAFQRFCAPSCKIVGFNISRSAQVMQLKVQNILKQAEQQGLFDTNTSFGKEIHVVDGYVGPGYARADRELYQFLKEIAQNTGLIFDPVYTGKAMFGLIHELHKSKERADFFGNEILFIHTGGLASIFAHSKEFSAALGWNKI